VVVDGKTEIGDDTIIYPFATVGMKGQDLKYQDDSEMTGLVIGKRCRIREYATIQSGTPASRGTKIGDDCQIMVNAHVAHDCQLGNNIVLSNLVQLAGHVEIEDFAIISAMSAIHQFCHIGEYAFLGAMSGTPVDIPPYVIYEGAPARYRTINKVGLARHGFTPEDMRAIHLVYSEIFNAESAAAAGEKIDHVRKQIKDNQYAMKALDFIMNSISRGINMEHGGAGAGRGIIAGRKANYDKA
jgi:UDP-N-acetylglucosamine acyltransferase